MEWMIHLKQGEYCLFDPDSLLKILLNIGREI